MKLKIAQVIGLNTDQRAAQVTSAVRDGNTFLAVLDLKCDDAFTKGRQVLSELEDFYFEFEGSATEKLSATFAEAENKFPKECGFDLVLAVVSGKVLYIIGKGQVDVYLKRKEKLSPLLSAGAQSQLISGFLQDSDRFLLCTNSLIVFLGEELEKTLSLPFETFEEEIEGKIGASDLGKKPSEYPFPESQAPLPESTGQGLAALMVEVMEENLDISPLPSEDTDRTYQVDQTVDSGLTKKQFALFKTVLNVFLSLSRRLGSYFPKSGRGRLILAIALIVIVSIGVVYKYKASRDAKIQAEFNQVLREVRDDFDAAKGLASLSPTDAKNKLDFAKDKIGKALALKPNDQEARNLKKQIEEESPLILQQAEVSDFPVFLDMDLVKKDFRAEQMSLSGEKLLLLDPGVKTLAAVDLKKKSNQILAGSDQLGDAVFASLNGGFAFVYSKDKGVLRIDILSQKITTVSKKDDDWGEIGDIYGFAGNAYLLDSGSSEGVEGQIWKYLPTADGYSSKREYLNKDTKADFGKVLKMQIESSIYVVKSGGEILRFTRGAKDHFSLEGLDKGVKDPKSFFVSSDTDDLYVLDSGNSRLLILTKTGSYKGQISGDKFATATDLVVDEKGKKVYLLEGSKIYSVDLK